MRTRQPGAKQCAEYEYSYVRDVRGFGMRQEYEVQSKYEVLLRSTRTVLLHVRRTEFTVVDFVKSLRTYATRRPKRVWHKSERCEEIA